MRLRARLRVDRIGKRFGLGEIELVVGEGALGEFAGLRRAQARQSLFERRQNAYRRSRASAVNVKLGDVVAG